MAISLRRLLKSVRCPAFFNLLITVGIKLRISSIHEESFSSNNFFLLLCGFLVLLVFFGAAIRQSVTGTTVSVLSIAGVVLSPEMNKML